MNENNQELTGNALLRYIMRRFNMTRSAALGSMPEEHRAVVLKEEQARRDAWDNSLAGLRDKRQSIATRIEEIEKKILNGVRCRDTRPKLQHKLDALDKRILSEVWMPSHTEVAKEVDKLVDGWRDCDSTHNREDLDDLIHDLCQYRESIATADEYHRANKL